MRCVLHSTTSELVVVAGAVSVLLLVVVIIGVLVGVGCGLMKGFFARGCRRSVRTRATKSIERKEE